MNTKTFLSSAALIFGLAATGATFAQVTPNVDPSQMTAEQRDAFRAQRQSEMAAMTPDQRAGLQASRGQAGSAQGQGKGTMARDGSGTGGQHGKAGGQGGGRGKGR